ncbi:MAG: hypothetical protein R3C01_06475 [Planctomycetaceae bacterium]
MFDDPVVLQTRKHRDEYAAAFGYDLDRIVADLQSRQGRDGRTVVNRSSINNPESSESEKALTPNPLL